MLLILLPYARKGIDGISQYRSIGESLYRPELFEATQSSVPAIVFKHQVQRSSGLCFNLIE